MHQSFIRMVNQQPPGFRNGLQHHVEASEITLHVLRNLPGELAYTSAEVLYRGATCSASCN